MTAPFFIKTQTHKSTQGRAVQDYRLLMLIRKTKTWIWHWTNRRWVPWRRRSPYSQNRGRVILEVRVRARKRRLKAVLNRPLPIQKSWIYQTVWFFQIHSKVVKTKDWTKERSQVRDILRRKGQCLGLRIMRGIRVIRHRSKVLLWQMIVTIMLLKVWTKR